MRVIFQLEVPVVVKREENYFIAHCPALDIYSQGKTENSSKKNLVEAIQLFLISCFERGTLDTVLRECGFRPVHSRGKSKKPKVNIPILTIPLPFLVKDNLRTCHA